MPSNRILKIPSTWMWSAQIVRRIVEAGHELASHGYAHIRATRQRPEEFRDDVVRTKKLLEDIGSTRVRGYRGASYSIGAKNLWALDELHRAGYEYSSSIYPVRHDFGGMPEAPRFAFRHGQGTGILEIPITTVQIAGRNFPCGGGGYFYLNLRRMEARLSVLLTDFHRDRVDRIFLGHAHRLSEALVGERAT